MKKILLPIGKFIGLILLIVATAWLTLVLYDVMDYFNIGADGS